MLVCISRGFSQFLYVLCSSPVLNIGMYMAFVPIKSKNKIEIPVTIATIGFFYITLAAKVLNNLLNHTLDSYLKLNNAQFGFRSRLSTETAILRLKHTVSYYTDRKTKVYANLLELSKLFYLVSCKLLWQKWGLDRGTSAPLKKSNILIISITTNKCCKVVGNGEFKIRCGVR